mgnify:CR=1 FL=1
MRGHHRRLSFYLPPPILIGLFWLFGWEWPMWLLAGAIWISFATVILATGITRLVNEPLSVVTVHISKVRSVPSKQELLLSIAIMLLTVHTLIHAGFPTTLLAYIAVCVINLVTRAISWYSRLEL